MDDDKLLTCFDCKAPFVFSASEQIFFEQKGLANVPKRCPNCRVVLRVYRNGGDLSKVSSVACADCGRETRVPFQPKGHRPVYCSFCLHVRKAVSALPTCS